MATPALAGWLPRGGDVVRDADGRPVPAHQPILPADQWEQLQPLVTFQKRRPGRPAKTLLAGLLRCPCGGRMGGGGIRYLCPAPRTPGVVHAAIVMQHADDAIRDKVLGHLIWLGTLEPDNPTVRAVAEAWGAATGSSADQAERQLREDTLAGAQARLQRTVRLVAEGGVDEADIRPLLAEYRQAVRTAEARLTELGGTTVDLEGLLDLTRPKWEALPLERRRLVLRAVLTAVDLRPGRLAVEWRLRPRWIK